DGSQRKLLGTVKYRSPGEYLISLRHNTGIEAARIFIKGDSVMVNDRINRNLYIAENDYLQDRFGIGTTLVPLVFGDFLETMTDVVTLKDCRSGVSEIQGYAGNRDIWYCIDCKSGKASSVTVSDRIGRNSVSLSFGEYRKTGYFIYPGRIKIEDNSGLGKISISVNSVEFRDSQKLEFLPGRNYKKIILK
ncbi:MAG TPA: DUF4292 domain-containing protein, partial [Bacteroidales bacterium]|nr:DUF4292 domain-containing protein [Bacteroidales bacterium]